MSKGKGHGNESRTKERGNKQKASSAGNKQRMTIEQKRVKAAATRK